jgi:hypothetical protein
MNKATFAGVILIASIMSACAQSPSSIPPVAVASSEYSGLSCSALRTELNSVEIKLADATRRQNNAQAADAVGVFLVLVPVSKLTGDAAGEVGQYKGEKLAIERALQNKKC